MSTSILTEPEIRPVSPRLGAEVSGVDLNRGGTAPVAERLRQAFADHKELGGHTLWADLQAAYDDPSQPFKSLLEATTLLPFLLSHTASPNYVIDFGGWQPGDFVLWDNLATLHLAVNDYEGPRAYQKVLA